MAAQAFEYDVFLSFASADQDTARPLWQELGLSGLRVFWSDSALRDRAGSSWFEIIQDALDRSRHLVILFTPESLQSTWVKREYVAFFNHCYKPPMRLLVPVMAPGVTAADLPLFLREVEACRLNDSLGPKLAKLLGGTDIEGLRAELTRTQELLRSAEAERDHLRAQLAEARKAPLAQPEPQQPVARTGRAASGWRLFRIAAILNAILGLAVILADIKFEETDYGIGAFLAVMAIAVTLPGLLWFAAGAIASHPRPLISAVLPALLIFGAASGVSGVEGAGFGMLLGGLGPLGGSVYLQRRPAARSVKLGSDPNLT